MLDQSGLYDLAAAPYFMVKLILHARQGRYPQTRTQALQDLIEDAIDQVVETMIREGEVRVYNRQGMHTHVDLILGALAWQMQFFVVHDTAPGRGLCHHEAHPERP